MFICAAGDIHGAMNRLYDDILAFEKALGVPFDYVFHVGDFGVWPDPDRIDKATRKHDGAGDFPVWFAEIAQLLAPRFSSRAIMKTLSGSTSSSKPVGARFCRA
jgi:hypothetical protein